MASVHRGKHGIYNVFFTLPNGQRTSKSTKTKDKREARRIQANVEDTLNLINTGRLAVPENVALADFILSGGKVNAVLKPIALEAATKAYLQAQRQKQQSTKNTEEKHFRHMVRIIGATAKLDRVDQAEIKRYVETRRKEFVTDGTIHKELTTFEQLWAWAVDEQYAVGHCPTKKASNPRKRAIALEKKSRKEEFRTWAEIERKIQLENLSEEQAAPLWERLYLDENQIAELLSFIKEHKSYGFLYLAFALAAYAGLRRSEISAGLCTDAYLGDGLISIRENKRRKDMKSSVRRCMLSPSLKGALTADGLNREYLAVNSDGKHMSPDMLSDQFRQAVKGSKWEVLRGWHTLRHSFASICLRKGVPIHVTAKWMGHTTQEMIELYQKTFPQDEANYAQLLD